MGADCFVLRSTLFEYGVSKIFSLLLGDFAS